MGNLLYQVLMLLSVFVCGLLLIRFMLQWNTNAKNQARMLREQTDLLKEIARKQGVSENTLQEIASRTE